MKSTGLTLALLLSSCHDNSDIMTDATPQPDAPITDDAPADGAVNSVEGTPGEFDPDLCQPYRVTFLDGSSAMVGRCTGIYYGGQTNLGQCLGTMCYNELEIMLPTTFVKGTKVPAVIYMHGGGWATGSFYEGNSPPEEEFLHRGFALISLNYRLSPQNTHGTAMGLDPQKSDPNFYVTMKSGRYDGSYPHATALADVMTAVQYVRSHMSQTIDGDNLIAMGHSAGGHLAAMLAVTGDSTNSNPDPNLRGRNGNWSTKVRAAIAMDPVLDFGVFVGSREQLPVCGELLTQANMDANMCGYRSHPAPPAEWDSTVLGTGLDDLCVDKHGPDNAYQQDTYGTNYFDQGNPWSTTMMGADPLVATATQNANYFQWLVSPTSHLSTSSAPLFIINGVCDAAVPARGARDFATRGATLGLNANQLTVVLPQGAGHNDALNESISPGINRAVRQWLADNGVAINIP